MKKLKIVFVTAFMLCQLLIVPLTAKAGELPDPDRNGSITVTIATKKGPVQDGSLLLYQIAEMIVSEEGIRYEINKDFDGLEIDLEHLTSGEQAHKLRQYVTERQVAGRSLAISGKGIASVDKLPLGIYLLMQDKAGEAYRPINPFVISLPMEEDGRLVYDVDASPKVETEDVTPPVPDTEPDTEPDNPPDRPPHLPQTGQLWWPVPILLVAGIFLIAFGLIKKRRN